MGQQKGQQGQGGQAPERADTQETAERITSLVADFVRLKSVDFGSSRARLLDSEAVAYEAVTVLSAT